MSDLTNSKNNQEIDLLKVTNNLSNKLSLSFNYLISFTKFIKKNIIYIFLLFVLGTVLGFLFDKNFKKYTSNIIVSPNFETVDYLYDKVELLNSDFSQEKANTLASLQIDESKNIEKIEIEPIDDIYKFIRKEETYLEVFKIMSENNDAKKVIDNFATSKNFTLHKIAINSSTKLSEEDLQKLMKYINNSKYYNDMRVKILANLEDQIVKNNQSIAQIDSILNTAPSKNKVSSSLSINDNTELNNLFLNKKSLILENHDLNVHRSNLDYIVTPINYTPNIINEKGLNGKMKFILPVFFVGGFIILAFGKKYF